MTAIMGRESYTGRPIPTYFASQLILSQDRMARAHSTEAQGNQCSVAFLLAAMPVQARTIHVPSEQPTIQAGIDAVGINGDTVLVADGTYTGPGNRDLNYHHRNLVVLSENGPDFTTIDCQGSATEPHRGFIFEGIETPVATVNGFTVVNGYAAFSSGMVGGAGMYMASSSSTAIENCKFESCYAVI